MSAPEIIARFPQWIYEMGNDPSVEPEFLPPVEVLICLYGTPRPEQVEDAARWIDQQEIYQEQATILLTLLDEKFPITDKMLKSEPLDLPSWVGEKWAMLLHVEWSKDLGKAIEDAQIWLAKAGISVNLEES